MSGGELVETTPEAAVVVGSRFCAPAATAFAVTKTISVTGRDFTVTDARGAAVMQVEEAVFSFLQHRSLLLRSSTRRRAAPLLTLQDSTYLASTRWEAYRGDSTSRRNLLFVAVKTAPVQLARTKVRVFLAGNGSSERVPDFVIGGRLAATTPARALSLLEATTPTAPGRELSCGPFIKLTSSDRREVGWTDGSGVAALAATHKEEEVASPSAGDMPWPWESTAALVDARYTTTLTVTRSKTPRGYGFAVTDGGSGAAVMQVETSYFGGGRDLRSLLFLGAATRRPLLLVEESPSLFRAGRRWEALRGRCASQADRLFLAVDRARFFFELMTNVDVFLNGNSSGEGEPDLAVQSSDYGNAMTVSRRGAAIAKIDKKRSTFWADLAGERAYNVRVNPGVDQVLVLALTVVLDQMHNPDYVSRCSCGRRR
ncbi:hypothetical protein CFC21_068512 [Triticum aestivum]|uniref:Uncharacterized protein n=2 Tax=Triticum aestivum TaxID=4565 RepID=A0A3B6KSD5_WHEAT|nr:hypothetical protein CFC21_068512 [Triticum aestivum]